MPKLDHLYINCVNGVVRDILLNGKPIWMISRAVVELDANDISKVTLHADIPQIEVAGDMDVYLDDETVQTLTQLGWTPPADPENEDKVMIEQFAAFTWRSRWNKPEMAVMSSQSGPDVVATGFFGYVRCDLRRDEDIAAIVRSARAFADHLENMKKKYDAADEKPLWSKDRGSPRRNHGKQVRITLNRPIDKGLS